MSGNCFLCNCSGILWWFVGGFIKFFMAEFFNIETFLRWVFKSKVAKLRIRNIYSKEKCIRKISRLNRIKKIDAHRNGTVTTEKYLKWQEFWCISRPPENSGSREIFISSFRHFESKFGCYFAKVTGNFTMYFGSQP